MRLLAGSVLAIGMLAGACGGASSTSTSTSHPPDDEPTATTSASLPGPADDALPEPAARKDASLPDPCTLVTDTEVFEVTGDPVVSKRSNEVTPQYVNCLWSDGTADHFILTVQTDHDWDLLQLVASSRPADDYRMLDGVGDRAFVALERTITAELDGVAVTAEGRVASIARLEAVVAAVLDRL